MIDPDGGRFTYSYLPDGLISQVINPQLERTTFGYDLAGREIAKYLANFARASTTYDAANRVSRLANVRSDGTTICSFSYKYDNSINRIAVAEEGTDRVTWTYDNTYQLTREHRSGVHAYDTTYVYDSVGNRLVTVDGSSRVTSIYNAGNQLAYSIIAPGRTTFSFDANGNQILELAPDGGRTTNVWGYENRLSIIVSPNIGRVTNLYDPDGRRVRKEEAGATTRFLWDNENVLIEADDSHETTAEYTYAPLELYGNLVSMRREVTSFYNFDAIGSTSKLTDLSGAITDSYTYKAFGEQVASLGLTNNHFRYIGRQGYVFEEYVFQVRSRWLKASIGRWLSVDPLGFADGTNLYVAAANRPVVLVDPSGLYCSPCCCCVDGASMSNSMSLQQRLAFYERRLNDPAFAGERSRTQRGIAGYRGDIANGNLGHWFETTATLSYHLADTFSDCQFEWWEWSNLTFDPRRGLPLQTRCKWHLSAASSNPSAVVPRNMWISWHTGAWDSREFPCPGQEQVKMQDTPTLTGGTIRSTEADRGTPGMEANFRVLEIWIEFQSSPKCSCGFDKKVVNVCQVTGSFNGRLHEKLYATKCKDVPIAVEMIARSCEANSGPWYNT